MLSHRFARLSDVLGFGALWRPKKNYASDSEAPKGRVFRAPMSQNHDFTTRRGG